MSKLKSGLDKTMGNNSLITRGRSGSNSNCNGDDAAAASSSAQPSAAQGPPSTKPTGADAATKKPARAPAAPSVISSSSNSSSGASSESQLKRTLDVLGSRFSNLRRSLGGASSSSSSGDSGSGKGQQDGGSKGQQDGGSKGQHDGGKQRASTGAGPHAPPRGSSSPVAAKPAGLGFAAPAPQVPVRSPRTRAIGAVALSGTVDSPVGDFGIGSDDDDDGGGELDGQHSSSGKGKGKGRDGSGGKGAAVEALQLAGAAKNSEWDFDKWGPTSQVCGACATSR